MDRVSNVNIVPKLERYYCEVRKRWVRPEDDPVPPLPPVASEAVPDHFFRKPNQLGLKN